MPKLVPASALALFAVALFASCGGGSAVASTCSSFCQAVLGCYDPSTCTLADPAATQAACYGDCQGGFTALTPDESTLVEACLQCAVQATPGACPESPPSGACSALCGSPAAKAAGAKWETANWAAAGSTLVQCSGLSMPKLGDFTGFQTCDVSSDATGCAVSCCFGSDPCETPDVGITCAGSGTSASDCTCSAGKNTGKTVQATGCAGNLWVLCNQ